MTGSEARTWQRVRACFDLARELPRAEREAWLAEHLEGDDELREEVRALLRADDGPSELLDDGPFGRSATRLADESADPLPGATIDGFRVGARLGEGGTSTVFEGVAPDGARVAIKVLKRGFGFSSIPARFRRERAALEALDHPGVPRVLGAGELDDGRPYLVTELVDGRPIDAFCDERGLGREARLRLFLELCAVVHDAHRHLVVHRDLKPSNLYVTGDGRVRVLDFGLAKLLGDDAGRDPDWTGVYGPGPRTPAFASPEQIEGAPVTTASDVYSLGVVLHHLVAGSSPYRARPTDREGLEREVVELGVDLTASGLPRDLAAILHVALRRRPSERYASARHLAEDVQRYLDRRPVRARRWRPLEAAVQLVRRRPLSAAALVGLVALVAGGWLGTLRSLERVSASEGVAWRAHAQAVHVTRLLGDVLEQVGEPADEALVRALHPRLVEAEGTLADLAAAPEAEARLRMALGRAFLGLGDPVRAEAHARRALELSLDTRGLTWRDADACLALLAEALAARGDPEASAVAEERVLRLEARPESDADLVEAARAALRPRDAPAD